MCQSWALTDWQASKNDTSMQAVHYRLPPASGCQILSRVQSARSHYTLWASSPTSGTLSDNDQCTGILYKVQSFQFWSLSNLNSDHSNLFYNRLLGAISTVYLHLLQSYKIEQYAPFIIVGSAEECQICCVLFSVVDDDHLNFHHSLRQKLEVVLHHCMAVLTRLLEHLKSRLLCYQLQIEIPLQEHPHYCSPDLFVASVFSNNWKYGTMCKICKQCTQ